jgi:hypothetical protein
MASRPAEETPDPGATDEKNLLMCFGSEKSRIRQWNNGLAFAIATFSCQDVHALLFVPKIAAEELQIKCV